MRYLAAFLLFTCATTTFAQNKFLGDHTSVHFQTTYVYQYKPSFSALYSGKNSLSNKEDHENSVTATVFLGLRLWKGCDFFLNPELAGGSGLNGALGMGGSSNGETYRVGNPAPSLYLARGYFRQTFALDGARSFQPADENEFEGREPDNFVRFYIGKMSLSDIFDNNEYSNSPREQFFNWSLMNTGSWDYAANVRGYTHTAAAHLKWQTMEYKLALAMLPKEANGAELEKDISKAYGITAEVDKAYELDGKKGNVRILYFYNNANMGRYSTSIAISPSDTPDITATRKYHREKNGFCISADQQLSDYAGIFLRAGWNDGKTESWVYTEIDNTICLGVSLAGKAWQRKHDNIGIAVVTNGLSRDHQRYLKAGGNGFILGDGNLNYNRETIAEVYYSLHMVKHLWLSGDYQFVANPGYNADRGPASIFSVRMHVGF